MQPSLLSYLSRIHVGDAKLDARLHHVSRQAAIPRIRSDNQPAVLMQKVTGAEWDEMLHSCGFSPRLYDSNGAEDGDALGDIALADLAG